MRGKPSLMWVLFHIGQSLLFLLIKGYAANSTDTLFLFVNVFSKIWVSNFLWLLLRRRYWITFSFLLCKFIWLLGLWWGCFNIDMYTRGTWIQPRRTFYFIFSLWIPEVHEYQGHIDSTSCVSFSPSGKWQDLQCLHKEMEEVQLDYFLATPISLAAHTKFCVIPSPPRGQLGVLTELYASSPCTTLQNQVAPNMFCMILLLL